MYLENITTSADVKKLNLNELKILAAELRDKIVATVSANGGHFASNLGIIEVVIAIHYVFDIPTDKLLFDVGHQCYAHKLLTGRYADFGSLRQEDGVSGFPAPEESSSDCFIAGHAGNSTAAALGFCKARDLRHEEYSVINVVGDAAFLNGLSLEAVTFSGEKPNGFLTVLNDNGMSIAKNDNEFYQNVTRSAKSNIKDNLFTSAGYKKVYFADGNDLEELISVLKRIKTEKVSALLNVKTVKGKGHVLAEAAPEPYHAVGENLSAPTSEYATVAGETVAKMAETDDKIVAITAGMKKGTGLDSFAEKFKDRFFDVGIAEECAVTFAAGMAKAGLKPFAFVYSTFLQRAYDEIIHDVCIQNLPVVFCVNRAGVVGGDGVTHQGVFDLSFLRHIPNMTVLAPKDVTELVGAIKYAFSLGTPVAIRYPSGDGVKLGGDGRFDGKWEKLRSGSDCTVLAVGGRIIESALALERYGLNATVYNARSVKPLDGEVLSKLTGKVFTLEDNVLSGGFGSAVCEYVSKNNKNATVIPFGLKDEFIKHASVEAQLKDSGLDAASVSDEIKKYLKR